MTGEHLSADLQTLLRLFHRHGVRYLLVGGEAVVHYGYPRFTGDVDLFYDRSPANAQRLYRALREFWNGEVPAVGDAAELTEENVVFQFGRPPNRVDLLSTLGSVRFSAAWRRRKLESLRVGRTTTPLPIISLRDLLQSKRDAGRHKDLDDVAVLSSVAKRPKRRTSR